MYRLVSVLTISLVTLSASAESWRDAYRPGPDTRPNSAIGRAGVEEYSGPVSSGDRYAATSGRAKMAGCLTDVPAAVKKANAERKPVVVWVNLDCTDHPAVRSATEGAVNLHVPSAFGSSTPRVGVLIGDKLLTCEEAKLDVPAIGNMLGTWEQVYNRPAASGDRIVSPARSTVQVTYGPPLTLSAGACDSVATVGDCGGASIPYNMVRTFLLGAPPAMPRLYTSPPVYTSYYGASAGDCGSAGMMAGAGDCGSAMFASACGSSMPAGYYGSYTGPRGVSYGAAGACGSAAAPYGTDSRGASYGAVMHAPFPYDGPVRRMFRGLFGGACGGSAAGGAAGSCGAGGY